MRFSNLILGVLGSGVAVVSMLAACGGDGGNAGGSGGAGSTGTNMTTSTGNSTGAGACSPTSKCTAVDKECIGLVDNKGLTTFGLRMSQLDVTAPAALTKGI